MNFEITHITEYTYLGEVFLEPHFFRFKPKNTPHLFTKEFDIKIEPDPTGSSEQIDIENNHILLSWFDGMHTQLRITSRSLIEVQEYNPFNFLVHPTQYLQLPFEYDEKTLELLKPSLNSRKIQNPLLEYCDRKLAETNNKSIDFLLQLTRDIHTDFKLIIREIGEPQQPDYTFLKKTGSCRDLAWMQIQVLRHLGIASRFVSGYYYVEIENPEFELHAWVEAYLPGAGWIGLDPSHGILTSARHIPVASSAFFENTMPVSGAIRGEYSSTLKNELNISLLA